MTTPDFNPEDYIFDIESYPNFFSCIFEHALTDQRYVFEVSDWVNNATEFCNFMEHMRRGVMWGFNNIGYDYPVIYHCLAHGSAFIAADAYHKTTAIIDGDYADPFKHLVKPWEITVPQVDLYKIHHFDNRARSTSLKMLEFNMQSENVGDLPFPPGTVLTYEQGREVIRYNGHDVSETKKFARHSLEKVKFREALTKREGINMMNFNDTKIGKKYFQIALENASPGITGTSRAPKQTLRDTLPLVDVIFPYVTFESPEFNNILNYLRTTVLTETNKPPELKDLSATVGGFTFDFGAGGMHGSVKHRKVQPPVGCKLIDIDVTSFYPSLAIQNRLFPEHLSDLFCDIYSDLFEQRKTFTKKQAENAMLKLALNGVYGASSDKYSPFYDPKFTMAITINGQLLLCMLAEQLMNYASSELIQINTDGMTLIVPDTHNDRFRWLISEWEKRTLLKMEYAEYQCMWIRDVNNYIAQYIDGNLKRKGAYEYIPVHQGGTLDWNKNHSALIVPRAAEAFMVNGVPVRDTIEAHKDAFDFMLRAKGSKKIKLELTDGTPLQRLTRYHIAHQGHELRSVHQPLARTPDKIRHIGINKGWPVAICDNIRDYRPENLNVQWYINETEKLIIR